MNPNEVISLFSKELWNNTNPSQVTVEDFEKLDKALSNLDTEEKEELKNHCETLLAEDTKDSIAVRYLTSVCGRHPVDDTHIFAVLEQYYNARLWDSCIYIAKRILQFNESSFVLSVLADCYATVGNEEEKIKTWERLIRADYSATETAFALGEYYQSRGEILSSLKYFNRVLKRNIKQNDLTSLKNVWAKIQEIKGDNNEFMLEYALKCANELDHTKAVVFLSFVLETGNYDLDTTIAIMRKVIELDRHNTIARDRIVELFREKYSSNPRLEYCLEDTGLTKNYMDLFMAVEKFEREVLFIENAFVRHESFGIGIIKTIEKDSMNIVFVKGGARKMSLSMAFQSLTVVPKTDLSVLKACAPADKLAEKFMEDIKWGLKTILVSNGGKMQFERMKSALCPSAKEKAQNPNLKSILSEEQLAVWVKKAKDVFKDDPFFTMMKEGAKDVCILRSTPITIEEKFYMQFRNEQDYEKKLSVLREFMNNDEADINSDEFQNMISYFKSRSLSRDKEAVYAYILLDSLRSQKGLNFIELEKTFADYYENMKDSEALKACFSSVKESESRKSFIDRIIAVDPAWQDTLVELLPLWTTSYLTESIKRGSDKKCFIELLATSVQENRLKPELFIWLAKNATSKEWNKAGYSEQDLLTSKLILLSYLTRQIANSEKASDLKATANKLSEIIFGNDEIYKILKKSEETRVRSIWGLVTSIETEMFNDEKKAVENFIKKNFDFGESLTKKEEKTVETTNFPSKLLCTRKMMEKKHEEFIKLRDVELPANSKDIGEAKALGDLRENSEYQYAKDKRKELNARFATLSEQLENAKPVSRDDVNDKSIGFGTVAVLHDNIRNADITYTIMGPWESDPDNNILNFQAPMGRALYGLAAGKNTKFEINGTKYDFTVKTISVADFE